MRAVRIGENGRCSIAALQLVLLTLSHWTALVVEFAPFLSRLRFVVVLPLSAASRRCCTRSMPLFIVAEALE